MNACPTVLDRLGYDKASSIDIAEEAGVATGTLYEYFPNKESICMTYMSMQIEKAVDDIGSIVKKSPRNFSKRKLKIVLYEAVLDLEKNRKLYHRLIQMIPDAANIAIVEEAQRKILKLVKLIGAFYRDNEGEKQDLELLVYIIFNASVGLLIRTLNTTEQMEPKRLASGMADMICAYAETMGISIRE